ncbi:MAG: hypothetical protein AB7P40_24550 [Chloroflexota bacterium]
MENASRRCAWVIKRHLHADALIEYVTRLEIERPQVVAITEPQDGTFTLIFEPNDRQLEQSTAEESDVAETLDTLFGTAVTPVQTPSGAEVETVITPNITPGAPPMTTPTPEPSPS